jgi:hypothetical protein
MPPAGCGSISQLLFGPFQLSSKVWRPRPFFRVHPCFLCITDDQIPNAICPGHCSLAGAPVGGLGGPPDHSPLTQQRPPPCSFLSPLGSQDCSCLKASSSGASVLGLKNRCVPPTGVKGKGQAGLLLEISENSRNTKSTLFTQGQALTPWLLPRHPAKRPAR